MPTVYTSGILNGKTKDFKEFAEHCTRSFMIQRRDEPFNSEFKPIELSTFYSDQIVYSKRMLDELDIMSDEELIKKESHVYENRLNVLRQSLEEMKLNKIKLDMFLYEAEQYIPPTEKHKGIAKFMIEQLTSTIDCDCDITYVEGEIARVLESIKNINADAIRAEIKLMCLNDIEQYTKGHEEEVKRVNVANKWYEDFMNSL